MDLAAQLLNFAFVLLTASDGNFLSGVSHQRHGDWAAGCIVVVKLWSTVPMMRNVISE